jgi:hypothetical protein
VAFGSDTIVEIKYATKIEWAGKQKFLGRKNCEEEFGLL